MGWRHASNRRAQRTGVYYTSRTLVLDEYSKQVGSKSVLLVYIASSTIDSSTLVLDEYSEQVGSKSVLLVYIASVYSQRTTSVHSQCTTSSSVHSQRTLL
jgi:hypothetical protein